jgi:glycosyltransferase involved in cell wall biosynthesis
MASGCAVISTDTYGIKDYLESDENGLMIPTEDPDAVAKAIQRLLSNPELGAELAYAGRETVEQHFRIQDAVERERKILEQYLRN